MTEEQFLEMIAKLEEVNQSVIKVDNDLLSFDVKNDTQNLYVNEKLVLYAENDLLQKESSTLQLEKIENLQYQVDVLITIKTYDFIFFGVIVAVMIVMLLFKGFKIRG